MGEAEGAGSRGVPSDGSSDSLGCVISFVMLAHSLLSWRQCPNLLNTTAFEDEVR